MHQQFVQITLFGMRNDDYISKLKNVVLTNTCVDDLEEWLDQGLPGILSLQMLLQIEGQGVASSSKLGRSS